MYTCVCIVFMLLIVAVQLKEREGEKGLMKQNQQNRMDGMLVAGTQLEHRKQAAIETITAAAACITIPTITKHNKWKQLKLNEDRALSIFILWHTHTHPFIHTQTHTLIEIF